MLGAFYFVEHSTLEMMRDMHMGLTSKASGRKARYAGEVRAKRRNHRPKLQAMDCMF